MENNNPNSSPIPGSAEHQKQVAEDLSRVVEGVNSKSSTASTDNAYNPLFDPKVKAHTDQLLSKLAQAQNEAKDKEAKLAELASKVDAFEKSQKEAARQGMSESQQLLERLKEMETAQTKILQTLAESRAQNEAKEFELYKITKLSESGIPKEYQDFVVSGARTPAELEMKISQGREIFKDVLNKVAANTSGQTRTEVTGSKAPPAAAASNEVPQAQGQSIIDRLSPEQRANVNLETLSDVIKNNPEYVRALNTKF